ncbi:uncharacterized protein PAC_04367 [Phialocephala subalpina]|uniref:Uncharacterized protein n=1 Tax=Phialocephala subalpina TaxID=576137 RepID=A0A1L7WNZ0_9HELO|nr:uncharacterized protein PAC_04367 [Phialocephala subalpina]
MLVGRHTDSVSVVSSDATIAIIFGLCRNFEAKEQSCFNGTSKSSASPLDTFENLPSDTFEAVGLDRRIREKHDTSDKAGKIWTGG